jgi:hypothetical protein
VSEAQENAQDKKTEKEEITNDWRDKQKTIYRKTQKTHNSEKGNEKYSKKIPHDILLEE